MKTEVIRAHKDLSFKMALKPVPKKASKIGGKALEEAALSLNSMPFDVEIIPKKGLLTQIKTLIFFVSEKGSKKGDWIALSKDPKNFLKAGSRNKKVDKFTKENILSAAQGAGELLENNKPLRRYTASLLPADTAIITKLFGL